MELALYGPKAVAQADEIILHPSRAAELIECVLMVGDTAWRSKDWDAASHAYQLVTALDPKHPHALNRLGRLALIARDPHSAVERFSQAFLAGAKDPATCVNLAVAYTRIQDYAQALYWCAAALIEKEDFLPAFIQQAAIYDEQGQYDDAIQIYERALALHPESDDLRFGLSAQLLKRGDYKEGWKWYEHRPDRASLQEKLDEYPEWRGESLIGKTLLVAREQGLGDQILFSRWLTHLIDRFPSARIVLYTYPELARLFAAVFPELELATCDQDLANVEPDYWVALGSLPARRFEPREEWRSIKPLPADVARFASLIPETGNLRVGLCWRGSPIQPAEDLRRIPWVGMQRLLTVPGCDFYSLVPADRTESGLVNLTHYVHDVADTAAAIANLDLVITSCTMVAHLAGAMGKPVWILLGKPAYWLWGRWSASTPWYPSATLIRAQEPKQWGNVIEFAKQKLYAKVAAWRFTVKVQTSAPTPAPATNSGETRYGRMTWPVNDRWVGRSLELYGEFSEAELDLMRQVIKPGDTVVECGAEIGGLTVGLADAVGSGGRVYAFEPQPFYLGYLERNAILRPIIPIPQAAGAETGSILLSAVEEQKVHAHGMRTDGLGFEVAQRRIDDLCLHRCALLKVDVDGMEHEILKGAQATIARCRPVLYVEYDKPDAYPEMPKWILDQDYRLYLHDAPLYNPNNFRANQVNVFGGLVSRMLLCIPNERKDLRFPQLQRIRAEKEQ